MDPNVLGPLLAAGIVHHRIVTVNAPALGGFGFAVEYDLSLRVIHPDGNPKHDMYRGDLAIVEQDLAVLGYEALIGRDVLRRCILILDGPSQTFTLAY